MKSSTVQRIVATLTCLVLAVACGSDDKPKDKGPELLSSASNTHTPEKDCTFFTAKKDGVDIFPIVTEATTPASR